MFMMGKKIMVILVLFCLLLTGCGVKSTVYKADQKEKILQEVAKAQLPEQEVQLLMQALMAEAFGARKLDGKTIGDIIDEQKKINEEKQKKEEEEKIKAEKLAQELAGYLTVSVENKVNVPRDTSKWIFNDSVKIDLLVANNSKKDISGFKGEVTYKDLFGDTILTSNYKNDAGIKSGEAKRIPLVIELNEFMPEHKKFFNTDLSKMKVIWNTKQIVFSDGQMLGNTK